MTDSQVITRQSVLGSLTLKERAVLDGLIQHKPGKVIASELGISLNTVDLRLRTAKEKLSAGDRAAAARVYRDLLETCGKSTCGLEVMAFSFNDHDCHGTDRAGLDAATLHDASPWLGAAPWSFEQTEPSGLEAFGDRLSPRLRLAMMVGTAALLAVAVLGTIAIVRELGDINIGSLFH